ncbi:MAG: hypothetical protein A2V85_17905 [Chloroflexi bacterium RBG_16_72_14]|nr:MAG: hypothetical protein A2V85_17905 [Chloroflexi bacterium RBG_16_72_14]
MTPRLVLIIAGLTVRELTRRRVLWVLLGLSLASVAFVGWGVERLVSLARAEGVAELQVRIGVSQVLILIAFMFSFVLAMSAAFLAAPAIASDVETGTVHAMLARPLRRSELVLGRWLGLSAVVAGYAAVSGSLAIGIVRLVSGHAPPEPQVAVAFLAFQAIAILTLALALGSRLPSMAAGAITVVVFGLGWFAGVLGNLAVAFDAAPLAAATDVVRVIVPTDGLWRGVVFGLEPPLVLLLTTARGAAALEANPFFASAPPPAAFVAWSVAWVALVLLAGMAAFRRREL